LMSAEPPFKKTRSSVTSSAAAAAPQCATSSKRVRQPDFMDVSRVVCPEMTVKIHWRRVAVQKLLTNGAFPVDRARTKIYFAPDNWKNPGKAACARVSVTRFACLDAD